MKIIFTGPRQAGKTTAANKIICSHPELTLKGYRTVFSPDRKLYLIEANEHMLPESGLAAVKDNERMKAVPGSFDRLGKQYISPAGSSELLLMDELGYIEKDETVFRNTVLSSAETSSNFIAVIRDGFPGWSRQLTKIPDVTVIKLFENCGSTSDECLRLLNEEGFERAAVIARGQSKGRGRAGRSFFSPADKGLYMSYGFHSERNRDELPLYSAEIAQIVSDVIRRETGMNTYIKEPNDVMYDGRKLCGILPDLYFDDNGRARLVIGIGVDLLEDESDFGDLKDIATSVKIACGKELDPILLAVKLLEKLNEL